MRKRVTSAIQVASSPEYVNGGPKTVPLDCDLLLNIDGFWFRSGAGRWTSGFRSQCSWKASAVSNLKGTEMICLFGDHGCPLGNDSEIIFIQP